MTHQLTFSDITDQRTLTESADAATDDTPETPTALLDRAQQHAMNVAAEHFPEPPVDTNEWEVSHRAQRQAGVTKYDPATKTIAIALTWKAYEHHGWKIQCDRPARTHSRLAVPRVRRRGSRRNVHPVDRLPRHLATLRTLHYAQVVARL
jgi:hypothetical protein